MELFHYPYRFVQKVEDFLGRFFPEKEPGLREIFTDKFRQLYDYFD